MTLSRSFTNKIKKRISSSIFENEKPVKPPFRPTISLPLERPDFVYDTEPLSTHVHPHTVSEWKPTNHPPNSPTSFSSDSSAHRSFLSSPATPRTSSDSRTSFNSGGHHFPSVKKKVSFSIDTKIITRRTSSESVGSSVYASEGELPPPLEDDEDISQKIGKFRFSAAEYIKEIEGTPLILVDGRLYL